MASLQLRHSRLCALEGAWTPEGRDGCTCRPTYHVVFRHDGRLVRERIGRNRQAARRALHKLATAADDGAYQPQRDIGFRDWSRAWLDSLERKPATVGSYRSTVAYAAEVFAEKPVRKLAPADLAAFNRYLREVEIDGEKKPRLLSDSTRAKHLRVLNA